MEKILSIYALLFVGSISFAQTVPSSTENYVFSTTCLTTDCVEKAETIKYFDGLGRPKQVVNVKASPTGKDLVTTIPYDGFGRQVDSWLHAPMTSLNGGIQTGVEGAATGFYGDTNPYSQKVLENSPLDRIQKQIQAGQDWSAKPVTFDYLAVQATDLVKKYTFTTGWGSDGATTFTTPTSTIYADNTLYKNSVKDEDGSETIEFKNGRGQTILVRKVLSSTENADTYYVYNDYDQLTYVISPLASVKITLSQTDLDNLCYQYRYDGKNRLVEKKLPGKGSEFMVYDQQDRLVLTQDANLRLMNNNFKATGWLFTKYDKFGRVAYTGFFPNGAKRVSMQNALSNMRQNAPNNEERTTSPTVVLQNMPLYYNNEAFPTGSKTLLTVNYYDTYPVGTPIPSDNKIQNVPILQEVASTGVSQTTKSLPTASFIKNIEDDNWTKNYSFYDRKGRVIGSHSINHLGGYTKTETKLDFAGTQQTTFTYHSRVSTLTPEIEIKERFIYNTYTNALEQHFHEVVGKSPEELLTENTYNEIGQLSNKKVGQVLQSVDYTFNIRGWLTAINEPANLGTKLFGYKIKYNNPDPITATVVGKFNGNIAEIDWSNSDDGIVRRYSYNYDQINRLLEATYQKPNTVNPLTHAYDEKVSYDQNGNILSLLRFGTLDGSQAHLIDALSYTYKGNQLTSVKDYSGNSSGFSDLNPNGSSDEYMYDNNGNMRTDLNKQIPSIVYNFLNLPTEVVLPNQNKVNYYYRANGTKIKMVRTIFQGNSTSLETTDYLNGFQYKFTSSKSETTAPKLIFFPTTEGYYNTDIDSNPYDTNVFPVYVYNYIDHLGNVRVSYYKDPTTQNIILDKVSNYYPFGLEHDGYNSILSQSYDYNYKYNGKELQETGMYDYGARMYMPDIGRWPTMDGKGELYLSKSPYSYANNTPVNAIDPDGNLVIFINGMHGGSGGSPDYWRSDKPTGYMTAAGGSSFAVYARFDQRVMGQLKDDNPKYVDGAMGGVTNTLFATSNVNTSATNRINSGFTQGKKDAAEIIKNLARDETTGAIVETIKIITHSMGGAYGKGYVKALKEYISTLPKEQQKQINISFEADFAPFQPTKQKVVDGVNTFQFSHSDDIVAGNKKMEGANDQDTSFDKGQGHSIMDFMDQISKLPAGAYKIVNGKIIPQN